MCLVGKPAQLSQQAVLAVLVVSLEQARLGWSLVLGQAEGHRPDLGFLFVSSMAQTFTPAIGKGLELELGHESRLELEAMATLRRHERSSSLF